MCIFYLEKDFARRMAVLEFIVLGDWFGIGIFGGLFSVFIFFILEHSL